MLVGKIILALVVFCAIHKCTPTDPVAIFNKITGFVKNEAEIVRDTITDTVNAVRDLLHPNRHRNNHPNHHPEAEFSNRHGWGHSHSQIPGKGLDSPGQGHHQTQAGPSYSGHGVSNYPAGQDSVNPNHPTEQGFKPGGQGSSSGHIPPGENPGQRPTAQGSHNPNIPNGESSSYPNLSSGPVFSNPNEPKNENNLNSSSTTSKPNKYNVDIRNNENGMPGNSGSNTNENEDQQEKSLLAYKGCAEGERKDRAGKCRVLS